MPGGYVLDGITSFPFEVNSMLLDEGVFDGVFTYKIKAPYTPNNLAAFGFANVLEVGKSLGDTYQVPVSVDNFNFEGSLQVIAVDKEGFGLTLNFYYGVLVDLWSKTYIDEMDFGTINFFANGVENYSLANVIEANRANYINYVESACARMRQLSELPPADSLVCFPIWEDSTTHYNLMRIYNESGFLNPTPYRYDLISGAGYMNVNPRPAIYLVEILKRALAQLGMVLDGDLLQIPAIERLIHFSEKSLVDRTMRNSFTESDTILGFTEWQIFLTTIEVRRFLPHITVLELIRGFKTEFFLGVFPDILNGRMWMNKFDTCLDTPYTMDLTDRVAGFVQRLEDYKDGFVYGYDRSIDSFAASFPDYSEIEFLPDVANQAALPPARKNIVVWVAAEGNYFSTYYDEDGNPLDPVWRRSNKVWVGERDGQGEYQRTFWLPGWMQYRSVGDPLTLPLDNTIYSPIVRTGEKPHNQIRPGFFTGRVYRENDAAEPSYYSCNCNGVPDAIFPFYLQFPDFIEFSLFVNSREGNQTTFPCAPGLLETFGTRFTEFRRRMKTDRFNMRMTMAEMLGLRMDQKVRIGNNEFFLQRARGNAPVTDEVEVEMVWVDPLI